jgi:RNA polymerase sigma-70 factor (ECF subfamily)
LEAVFRQHSGYVAAVAFRILGRREDVDDVVQDVFMSAMKRLETLKTPEALRSWLATITVRCSGRRLRVRRVRRFLGLDGNVPYDDVAGVQASPEDRLFLAQVYSVLDELPVDQRVAWTLRYIEGEQLDAVAAQCNCSLATVKRRIAAAQAFVEERLR